MTKIAVIIFSVHGHIYKLAQQVVKGIKDCLQTDVDGDHHGDIDVGFYRIADIIVPINVPSNLNEEMENYFKLPVIQTDQLKEYDGFIFGFPTRFGSAPASVKAFWDTTGQLWVNGALVGKYGAVFTSTATQHGGQEITVLTFISHYVHHGIIFVPLGYVGAEMSDNNEVVGGSPWGAATITNSDGSRIPTTKELSIAEKQGSTFANIVRKGTCGVH